jgi:hypothetical protein
MTETTIRIGRNEVGAVIHIWWADGGATTITVPADHGSDEDSERMKIIDTIGEALMEHEGTV